MRFHSHEASFEPCFDMVVFLSLQGQKGGV